MMWRCWRQGRREGQEDRLALVTRAEPLEGGESGGTVAVRLTVRLTVSQTVRNTVSQTGRHTDIHTVSHTHTHAVRQPVLQKYTQLQGQSIIRADIHTFCQTTIHIHGYIQTVT